MNLTFWPFDTFAIFYWYSIIYKILILTFFDFPYKNTPFLPEKLVFFLQNLPSSFSYLLTKNGYFGALWMEILTNADIEFSQILLIFGSKPWFQSLILSFSRPTFLCYPKKVEWIYVNPEFLLNVPSLNPGPGWINYC